MKSIFLFFALPLLLFSQSNEDCFDCHNDEELEFERNGKLISLFVNEDDYNSSIHGDMECIDCHSDFDIV